MHVGEIEFLLALGLIDFIVLLAVEVALQLGVAPLAKLLSRHQHRRTQILVTHLRTDQVAAQRVVVLHLLLNVLRHHQVGSPALEVFLRDGLRALYLPPRIEQRVGYLLVVDKK